MKYLEKKFSVSQYTPRPPRTALTDAALAVWSEFVDTSTWRGADLCGVEAGDTTPKRSPFWRNPFVADP